MTQPVGVILAGGQSRRMGGGDKCLRKLGDTAILTRVVERLEPQVADLALNVNGDQSRFVGFGGPTLEDSVPGFAGPLAGVLAALDWAALCKAEHVVTVAADTPFFPCDLVPNFLLATESAPDAIVLATSDTGRHPTFGLWPTVLREPLRAALAAGVRKVVVWTDQHDCRTAYFAGQDPDPFFNINTPEDLETAAQWI